MNLRGVWRGLRASKQDLDKWVVKDFDVGFWRRFVGFGENIKGDEIVFMFFLSMELVFQVCKKMDGVMGTVEKGFITLSS